jgi:hypothetical protein
MKVIIAGSRWLIIPMELVDKAVKDSGFDITEVVCGKSHGADIAGEEWAKKNKIPVKPYPAKWKQYSSMAGPIRNEEMGLYADAAIVLWDGSSRGSYNMIKIMERLGKPCFVFNCPPGD